MQAANIYRCTLCKRDFAFEDIRYSNDGKRLVCKGCYSKISNSEKGNQAKMARDKSIVIEEKIRVICAGCRYKFTLNKKTPSPVCPYCGKNRFIKDDIDTERLIKESSNSAYDF